VTEEKDLKSKMIVNDSEGDDTTREKRKGRLLLGRQRAIWKTSDNFLHWNSTR
jgi:hypothetical protein